MKSPGAWTIVRHVVRICGRVADERGTPLGGAVVTLWAVPEGTGKRPATAGRGAHSRGAVCALLDQTEARPDGLFFFLDCPGGRYAVKAVAAGAFGVVSVEIAADAQSGAAIAVADIAVPAAAGVGRR
jgi:hypothetical protein